MQYKDSKIKTRKMQILSKTNHTTKRQKTYKAKKLRIKMQKKEN